jgi:aspartate ammonia-lyase
MTSQGSSPTGDHAPAAAVRTETDFIGDRLIPAEAYWGIHTARALENFPISGTPLHTHRCLIDGLGAVKQAACRTNLELGVIDDTTAEAIDRACQDVRSGLLDEQFVVDVFQGGAGTSTNMNVNEVIANRALQLLGLPRGSYERIHPVDHVNRSQSTNDVYPTAVRLALVSSLDQLTASLRNLEMGFAQKAEQFGHVPKMGRTQLQDAVPMTVGQEFAAWAGTIAKEEHRIAEARALLYEINLGATAIGTGITARSGYAEAACRHLREITGLPLVTAADLIEATSDTGAFTQVSSVLKRVAVKVSKICNDLRLLSSGPQAGLGELRLPPRQAGSSVMPGKVNPVIPEVVNQVAFWAIGIDVTVTMAAESGQLQLNAFEPVICHGLLQTIALMTNAFNVLTTQCVTGIDINQEHLSSTVARSVGVVTALTPRIGYAVASEIAKAALAGEGSVRDLVLAAGLLTSGELAELLP